MNPVVSTKSHHAHFIQIVRFLLPDGLFEGFEVLVPKELDRFSPGCCVGEFLAGELNLAKHPGEFEHRSLGIEVVLERCARLHLHCSQIDALPAGQCLAQCRPFILHHLLTGAYTRFQCQSFALERRDNQLLVTLFALTLIEHGLEFESESGHVRLPESA